MYQKTCCINGFFFTQKMDLDTDTAIYEDRAGNLLMKVDSNGNATDAQDVACGRFKLDYPASTWSYEAVDGTVISTPHEQLFDDAEPFVIEKLFAQ